jgi:hypothetical protein
MLGDTEEVHEYGEVAYARPWYANLRRVSWGAIFAGLFVTLAIFLTLQMLGAGIGLSTVSLTGREVSSGTELGIGAAIWWFITGLIALFIGGWVTGRLASEPNKLQRALHGLTTWGLFYAVMFWMVTTALGFLAGGGLAMLGQGVSAAGEATASPQGQQAMENQGVTPEQIRDRIAAATGPGTTPEEQQAKETGEQAANITGATFIGLAISMLLGAIAAMLGSLAASAPTITVPPREYTRTAATRTEAGTYASR